MIVAMLYFYGLIRIYQFTKRKEKHKMATAT